MNYNIECLFPTALHVLETDVDERIKPYCLQAQQADPIGVRVSNRGGWQSLGNKDNNLITDILYDLFDNSISKLFQQELQILNHWININGPNNYNIMHDHPMCDLSGVYYINVPENSGNIYFQSPHNFVANARIFNLFILLKKLMSDAFNKFLSINILHSVESGSKDSSFHLIK